MTDLPALDENDKRCSHRDEDGKQCGGFHLRDSPFCAGHGDNLARILEKRKSSADRRKKLLEDLELNYHELQSAEGIALFYEKIANAVTAGLMKRDKAGLLMMMLPQMYKIAKDRKGGDRPKGFFSVQVAPGEQPKISATFTSENLDRFLMAGEHAAVQMLEDLQKTGNVKVEKRKDEDVIDVTATNVPTPDTLKVPAKELAALSKGTSAAMKPKQILDLFGSVLGDSEGLGYAKVKPLEPEPILCDFKGVEEVKGNLLVLWFVCQRCGARQANKTKEICPNQTQK